MWTDKNVELLKKLWGYGHSAAQIAARLECSRSAVCAKVQRLGLKRGGKASPTLSSVLNGLPEN